MTNKMKKIFYTKSNLWFFGWKSKRKTRITDRWRKKYFLAKLWNLKYSSIERFYRSKFDLIGNGSTKLENFRPIWTPIGQNGPWLINFGPNWPVIGQFEPERTKMARDLSMLTRNDENSPWLVNADPKWRKRPVIGQFGPELTKMTRGWSI